MKRSVIFAAGILAVLGLVWVAFAQSKISPPPRTAEAERAPSRRSAWRQRQSQAIAAIEEQLAKMKSAMQASSARRGNWQNLSDQEKSKLREQFRQMRDARHKSIAEIEDELAILKGRRTLQQEHEEAITKLNEILELAKKEKATETTAALQKLIEGKKKAFDERMDKLNLPQRTRTRNN